MHIVLFADIPHSDGDKKIHKKRNNAGVKSKKKEIMSPLSPFCKKNEE